MRAALLLAATVALVVSVAVCGVWLSDPTEHSVAVYLRNDVDTAAVVTICLDPRCSAMAPTKWRGRLALGGELPVNVSTESIPSTYKIVLRDTDPAQCLTVALSGAAPKHLVVPVSSAKPCANVP